MRVKLCSTAVRAARGKGPRPSSTAPGSRRAAPSRYSPLLRFLRKGWPSFLSTSFTETASANEGQECRRTKGEPRALRGVGRGNSPTVLSVRGLASTSGNGGAGTPRGRSSTEDGGPSTQRGEPLGDDGDGDRCGGLGQAVPQAPDVVMRIGSEAGKAAAFTATAALIKSSSLPGEAGGETTRPTKRGLAPRLRPSFTARSARSLARVTQTANLPFVAAALPPGALEESSGLTTSSATSLIVKPARTPFCNSLVAAINNRNDFGRNPNASRSAVASFSASNDSIDALTRGSTGSLTAFQSIQNHSMLKTSGRQKPWSMGTSLISFFLLLGTSRFAAFLSELRHRTSSAAMACKRATSKVLGAKSSATPSWGT